MDRERGTLVRERDNLEQAQEPEQDALSERRMRMHDEIASLAEETTELGVYAEDIFKNAAAGLYDTTSETAQFALETEPICARLQAMIHHKGLSILALYMPSADDVRRVVRLQQIAAEFARIAGNGREIAMLALTLTGSAEDDLLQVGGDAALALLEMIRQTYIEVRGCVVAVTTQNTAMARRLVREDTELDRIFLTYKSVLDAAIAANPWAAARLQRLLLVGVHLEEIGNRVIAICNTILYAPPPHHA